MTTKSSYEGLSLERAGERKDGVYLYTVKIGNYIHPTSITLAGALRLWTHRHNEEIKQKNGETNNDT